MRIDILYIEQSTEHVDTNSYEIVPIQNYHSMKCEHE